MPSNGMLGRPRHRWVDNNLPHEIKDLANDILPFRNALKRFLLSNFFYNSKEYFNQQGYSIEI